MKIKYKQTFEEWLDSVVEVDQKKKIIYLLSHDLMIDEIRQEYLHDCAVDGYQADLESIETKLKEIRGQ